MKGTILILVFLAWRCGMADEMVTTTAVEAVGDDVIMATTIEGEYIEEARISVLEDHLRTDRTAYISPSQLPPAAHDPATLYYSK